MPTLTLSRIETALRASWGAETAHASPGHLARGGGTPSRGQCGTTRRGSSTAGEEPLRLLRARVAAALGLDGATDS